MFPCVTFTDRKWKRNFAGKDGNALIFFSPFIVQKTDIKIDYFLLIFLYLGSK